MQNKNVNIKVVTCPPCGESGLQGRKGVIHTRHSRVSLSGIYNACLCQTPVMLNSFQHLHLNHPLAYRLGVSPTGTASMPGNITYKSGELSGSHPTYKGCRGFTLIELLVVVLIIGILAAVALPQYQKAVAKSRFAALKPLAKAVKDAEEIYFDAQGTYGVLADLDVQAPTGASLIIGNSEGHNYVRASNINLKNRYTLYFNHGDSFAGNVYCEAEKDNTVAEAVCVSEQGVDTEIVRDGYKWYLISGSSTGNFPYKLIGQDTLANNSTVRQATYSNGNNTISFRYEGWYYSAKSCDLKNECTTTHYNTDLKQLCEDFSFLSVC